MFNKGDNVDDIVLYLCLYQIRLQQGNTPNQELPWVPPSYIPPNSLTVEDMLGQVGDALNAEESSVLQRGYHSDDDMAALENPFDFLDADVAKSEVTASKKMTKKSVVSKDTKPIRFKLVRESWKQSKTSQSVKR